MLEKYYEGEDMLRHGRGGVYPERVAFSAERLHEVRSITKSMVSLFYGKRCATARCRRRAPLLARSRNTLTLPIGSSEAAGPSPTRHHDALGSSGTKTFPMTIRAMARPPLGCRRPLPSCPGTPHCYAGRRALELLRRRNRADRQDFGERHRARAHD